MSTRTTGSLRTGRHGRGRAAWAVALVAAGTIALAACSGHSGASNQHSSSGGSASPSVGHRGGTLTAAFNAVPNESLNAAKAVDDLDQVRAQLVYEKLSEVDTDFHVHPILYDTATHNADGTQWTFTLKQAAAFADGTPVEGQDVLDSITAYSGQDAVQNLGMIDMKRSTASGKSVTFVLTRATADLPLQFAMSFLTILPHGKGSTDPATMNGSGPYRVTSFVPGQRTVLERRADYWGGNARGMADKIVLIGAADPSARMNALLSHQVDLASSINLSDAASHAHYSSIAIHSSTSPAAMALILNAKLAPFDDVRVRQAFRLAVNRDQLASTVLSGIGKPGNDLWGAGFPGYATNIPQRTQDLAQAKKLLAEAGHPHVSLTVYTPQGTSTLTEGTLLIAQQVKAAGFDVTVKQLSQAEYYDASKWTTWPGVSFTLGLPFQTMAGYFYLPGAYYNFGWNDSSWNATFYQAQASFDQTKAQTLLDGLQKQLWDSGPDVVWGLVPTEIATTPNVGGLDQIADFNYPDLTKVWVR